MLIYVRWTHGAVHLDSSRVVFLEPTGAAPGTNLSALRSVPSEWISQAVKTTRTQYGIATDFCYKHGNELSLICPECGINSVRISAPEITHGHLSSRGLVVTIRCECENLHTFSVVFVQHKGITFVRTD